jgi:SAM-dependent methyltransferase
MMGSRKDIIPSPLMAPSDLLKTIREETWTSHNIRLTESEATIGMNVPPIGDDTRTKVIKSLIRRLIPRNDEIRIADLGSLEGGLSLELAREGWTVTGVEARESNYRKSELIREYFGLPNLRFRLQDVKALDDPDGSFDVIACCGLLYHIDNPFALLERLARLVAPGGFLFLDTHIAPDGQSIYTADELSEAATFEHGGRSYHGRWFVEPREGSILDAQWSATSNDRSFWPDRRSLIRALYHAGFHAIHELFGMFDIDGEFELREQYSRLYLVAFREW